MKLKTSKEIIVGFLLKIWPNKNNWSKSRQKRYLLNEEIKNILSVDETVHSSIDLDENNISHQAEFYFGQELLEECILQNNHLSIAVSMIEEPYKSLFRYSKENSIYIPNILLTPNNDFYVDFLGYDVGDFMLISSLTNCGFTIEVKNNLTFFKDKLNKYGLFSDIVTAEEYKTISDLRVKEHAPFYIFGLYQIKFKVQN